MVQIEHENLAVADLSSLCRRCDRLDDLVHLGGWASDLDFDFWQEAHGVFGAAIDFGMALLATVAFHLGDSQPLHADFGESVADLIEFEWLDDRHHDFHWTCPPPPTHCPACRNQAPCQVP